MSECKECGCEIVQRADQRTPLDMQPTLCKDCDPEEYNHEDKLERAE